MKTAKIFKCGNSMAVRLPKEMNIKGREFLIEKYGDMLILVPKGKAWKVFLEGIEGFSDDVFTNGRVQHDIEKREEVD